MKTFQRTICYGISRRYISTHTWRRFLRETLCDQKSPRSNTAHHSRQLPRWSQSNTVSDWNIELKNKIKILLSFQQRTNKEVEKTTAHGVIQGEAFPHLGVHVFLSVMPHSGKAVIAAMLLAPGRISWLTSDKQHRHNPAHGPQAKPHRLLQRRPAAPPREWRRHGRCLEKMLIKHGA